jgi:hypothetical protein
MQPRGILDQANQVLRRAQLRVAGLTLNARAPLKITVNWNDLAIPANTLIWIAAIFGILGSDGTWTDLTYLGGPGGVPYVHSTIYSASSPTPPANNIVSALWTLAPDTGTGIAYDVKAVILTPTPPYPTADYWGRVGASPNRLMGFKQSELNALIPVPGGIGIFKEQLLVNPQVQQASITSIVLAAA